MRTIESHRNTEIPTDKGLRLMTNFQELLKENIERCRATMGRRISPLLKVLWDVSPTNPRVGLKESEKVKFEERWKQVPDAEVEQAVASCPPKTQEQNPGTINA